MKKLNKKGFTLLEVLTVVIVITILMLITFPLINTLSNKNNEELYKSYERMMQEYVIASDVKESGRIMLYEIEGLDRIKEECEGFVVVDNSTTKSYTSYIKCGDKYTTNKYYENLTGSSTPPSYPTIYTCPGCKFSSQRRMIYTTWNSENWYDENGVFHTSRPPTVITSGLYDNYMDVVNASGNNYFYGVRLNSDNQVTNSYACGIKDDVPFCIEGTPDGSKNAANINILQGKNLWNNGCSRDGNMYYLGVNDVYCRTSSILAFVENDGTVFVSDYSSGFYASNVGTIYNGSPD